MTRNNVCRFFPILLGSASHEALPAFLWSYQAIPWDGRATLDPHHLDRICARDDLAKNRRLPPDVCPFVGLDSFGPDPALKIFQEQTFKPNIEHFRKLATAQEPRIMIIGCCDSRVDPAILTNSDPGNLFIFRNVANLVPPCNPDPAQHGTSAALEFAVTGLEVEHIIVLGHSCCGGIAAMLKSGSPVVSASTKRSRSRWAT